MYRNLSKLTTESDQISDKAATVPRKPPNLQPKSNWNNIPKNMAMLEMKIFLEIHLVSLSSGHYVPYIPATGYPRRLWRMNI